MIRTVFDEDHQLFRASVREFFRREVLPVHPNYERAGGLPREFWLRAGSVGILGLQVPEEFGGQGVSTFKFNAVVTEETQYVGVALGELRLQIDICLPYFLSYASESQKARWLPKLASGEATAALAMSEPDAGSDITAITTRAIRDGDEYIVSGSKTFITNGSNADLVITVVRTGDKGRHGSHSLLVVETGMIGFERGRRLQKIGLKAQDLAELSFTDVRVPADNLLGAEGSAFQYLTANLAQERLSIALNSQAAAAAAVRETVEYVQGRKAFGTTIGAFQNTKFELAACATDVQAGQSLVDQALEEHSRGELDPADAAMVKLFCTEMQGRVIDRCLQLHGGYGYITEYPIARAYADARVARIYGGSNEIMKVLVARSLGL